MQKCDLSLGLCHSSTYGNVKIAKASMISLTKVELVVNLNTSAIGFGRIIIPDKDSNAL
jgi:hypothetical protein